MGRVYKDRTWTEEMGLTGSGKQQIAASSCFPLGGEVVGGVEVGWRGGGVGGIAKGVKGGLSVFLFLRLVQHERLPGLGSSLTPGL